MSYRRRTFGIIAAAFALIIARALQTGTTYSRYSVIHRATDPGMYWNTMLVAAPFMAFCIVKFLRKDPADPK